MPKSEYSIFEYLKNRRYFAYVKSRKQAKYYSFEKSLIKCFALIKYTKMLENSSFLKANELLEKFSLSIFTFTIPQQFRLLFVCSFVCALNFFVYEKLEMF